MGAVCGNNFGAADANVVCQQAGFSQVIRGRFFGNSRFGNLPFGQQFVFTDLQCDGTENSVLNCQSITINNGQCQPNTVAGVNVPSSWYCQIAVLGSYDNKYRI